MAGAEVQVVRSLRALKKSGRVELRAIVFNEGKPAEELRAAGIETAVIDESLFGIPKLAGMVWRELVRFSPEVVHTHRYKENIIAAFGRKKCGIKALVQTVHGKPEPFKGIAGWKAAANQWLNAKVRSGAFDKVIAVSRDIENMLRPQLPASRLVTIHNAIDLDEYRFDEARGWARQELGVPEGTPVIGGVGRMVPVKNFSAFIAAAAELQEKLPQAVFVLIGDGPARAGLEAEAAASGLTQKIKFLGYRTDAWRLAAGFDVFVNSSLSEGIPVSILEAMAMQRPVVATAVGGVPEIIEDEASGILVRSGNVGFLADAVCRALQQTGLGEAGRRRVEEEFAMVRHIEKLLKVYSEVCA